MAEKLCTLRKYGGGRLKLTTVSQKLLRNNAIQTDTLESGKEYLLSATLRVANGDDFRMVTVLIRNDRTYEVYGAQLQNAYVSLTISGNNLTYSGTHASLYTEFLLLKAG